MSDDACRALPRETEKDWQAKIVQAARYLNWTCFHDYDSRRGAPGFPDLVCVKEGALLCIECKTARGRVRPEQIAWIELLDSVPGVRAMIARPSDWPKVVEALGGTA